MKKQFLYGAMAMGLILGGCSSDDLSVPDGQEPLGVDQTFYVRMTIRDDNSGSRSAVNDGSPYWEDDFENGTKEESGINNVYFVFYDAAGNVVGKLVNVDIEHWTVGSAIDNETIEKYYTSVVKVEVDKGQLTPAQVICYVNPITPGELLKPLGAIQTEKRPSTYGTVGDVPYFAMSNSVFYPFEGQTNKPADNAEPHIAVSIPATALYTSESAAEAAVGTENTVNIYVERYASKLKFTSVTPDDYVTATRVYNDDGTFVTKNVTLKFNPLYWAVNAESRETYVIKSFRQESELGEVLAHNYSWGTLNSFINPKDYDDSKQTWVYPTLGSESGEVETLDYATQAWKWDNPAYHRSYWGMSPAYFTAEYPEVSSDLKEFEKMGLTINQKYISFDELKAGTKGFEATNTTPQYFRETTVGSKALNSKNPEAAVASVIYVGKYTLNLDGKDLEDGTSFYTYLPGPVEGVDEDRPYIYFDNQEGSNKSVIAGGESMLYRFFAQSTILYRESVTEEEKKAGVYTRLTVKNTSDLNMLTDALEVSEISDEVKTAYDGDLNTKLKLQNNSRTLQFKSVDEADGIYVVTAGGYMKIVENVTDPTTEISLAQANVAIMGQVGFSYYYTLGHSYFNIPVKHYGWYRNGNEQKDKDKINWNKVRVGDFGMVRNHSYKVNVTEIKGLALGIGDDGNPIVPPTTPEEYYVAYAVHILKWAIVPQQDVKL